MGSSPFIVVLCVCDPPKLQPYTTHLPKGKATHVTMHHELSWSRQRESAHIHISAWTLTCLFRFYFFNSCLQLKAPSICNNLSVKTPHKLTMCNAIIACLKSKYVKSLAPKLSSSLDPIHWWKAKVHKYYTKYDI